jgi:hypothetical protein
MKIRHVDRSLFQEVMAKLDASGLSDELQSMVDTRHVRSPRRLSMTVFLTALTLVFRWTGTATPSTVHALLTTGLDRALQFELNIRDVPYGRHDDHGVLTHRQVQYLFHQIVRRVDPEQADDARERARRSNFLLRLQAEFANILIRDQDPNAVWARAVDSTPHFGWHLSPPGLSGRPCLKNHHSPGSASALVRSVQADPASTPVSDRGYARNLPWLSFGTRAPNA